MNIRFVGIVIRPESPEAEKKGFELAQWLNRQGIATTGLNRIDPSMDLIVVLGGHGTLLHAADAEAKKSVFLDDPNAAHTDDPQEHEANQWAGNWLIPEQYSDRLAELKSKASIQAFAEEIGVHPGIVVGRLQHDGFIHYSAMNYLKQKLDFVRG